MEYFELDKRIEKIQMLIKEEGVKYEITQEKDKSLKSLFEVKKRFVELLKTFVKEKWVEEIEEENIELADKEFIMSNIHQTRADLIYKVKNKDVYFILLEFQSTEDSNMPYRLLSYMLEIWRRYGEDKLPLVIPCVLYTGNKKWEVKTFRSLFNVSKELEKYIPDFEYVLIDVNNYTDNELMETANLVSSVVYMAKSKNEDEVIKKLSEIIKLIKKLGEKEQEAFIKWAEVMFCRYDTIYNYFEENLEKREEKDMALADLIPGVVEKLTEQGKELGRKDQLKRILTKKLKDEPCKKIVELIEEASEEKINEIEDKIFEIESWEEVENYLVVCYF